MYCHVVGSKRLRGERIEHMKEWARRGLQYHPKGSWRVWRGPAGDWIVKHLCGEAKWTINGTV